MTDREEIERLNKDKKEDAKNFGLLFILKSSAEDLENQSLTSTSDMFRKLKMKNKTNWQAEGRSHDL